MTDYTDYKELYLKCFTDDTEEDAELLFKTVLSKAEKVCEYVDGKPIAMLFLMDSNLIAKNTRYPFFYLYAACTHPDYRGQGIMGRLLEKAKEVAINKGKLGIFLKPANPPLFDFYAKSDFLPFFKVTKLTSTADEFLSKIRSSINELSETSMSDWHKKRKEYLAPLCDIYADFSNDLFTAATAGCTAVLFKNAAAVYELRDNTLLIKEAIATKGNEIEILELAASLLNKAKANTIELRLPAVYGNTFNEFGAKTTHFSVIWDNGALPKDIFITPYHGFAFD